jgi:hypothetical protein
MFSQKPNLLLSEIFSIRIVSLQDLEFEALSTKKWIVDMKFKKRNIHLQIEWFVFIKMWILYKGYNINLFSSIHTTV